MEEGELRGKIEDLKKKLREIPGPNGKGGNAHSTSVAQIKNKPNQNPSKGMGQKEAQRSKGPASEYRLVDKMKGVTSQKELKHRMFKENGMCPLKEIPMQKENSRDNIQRAKVNNIEHPRGDQVGIGTSNQSLQLEHDQNTR